MKVRLPHSLFLALMTAICIPGTTIAGEVGSNAYSRSARILLYNAEETENAASLRWDSTTGEPATWDTENTPVWFDQQSGTTENTYKAGSQVSFSEDADLNKSVQISPENVTAKTIEITGRDYRFSGGGLIVTDSLHTTASTDIDSSLIIGSSTSPLIINVAEGGVLTTKQLETYSTHTYGEPIYSHGSFLKKGNGTLSITEAVHGTITSAWVEEGKLELGKGVSLDVGANAIKGGTLENVQLHVTGDVTRTLTGETVTANNLIKSADGVNAAVLTDVILHAGTSTTYGTLQNVVFAGESTLAGYITFEETQVQREIGVATDSTLSVDNVTFDLRGIASGSKVLIVNSAVSDADKGLQGTIGLPGNIRGLSGTLSGWDTAKFVYSGITVNSAALDTTVAGMVTLKTQHDGALYWDGSEDDKWNATSENWSTTAGTNGDKVFTALSNVYFGSGNIPHKDITLTQDIVVMNLEVTGGDYHFSGSRLAVLRDAVLAPEKGAVTFNNQLIVQGNLTTTGEGSIELRGGGTIVKDATFSSADTTITGDVTIGGTFTVQAGTLETAGKLDISGNITAGNIDIAVSAGDKDGNAYNNELATVTGNLAAGTNGTIHIGGTAEQRYIGTITAGDLKVSTQEHEVYFSNIQVDRLTVDEGAYAHIQTGSSSVAVSSSSLPEVYLSGTLSMDAYGTTYNQGYDIHVQSDSARLRFGPGSTIDKLKLLGTTDDDGYTDLDIEVQSRNATVTQMQDLGNLSVNTGMMTVKSASGAVHGTLTMNNGGMKLAEGTDNIMASGSGAIILKDSAKLNIGTSTQVLEAGNSISLSGTSSITGNTAGTGLILAEGFSISYTDLDNAISANMVVDNNLRIEATETNSSLDITGKLSGNGEISLVGPGTVSISGENPFTGMVMANQGSTLSLQSEEALAHAGVNLANGATLQLDTNGQVKLNALTLNNGSSISVSSISGTSDFSAQDAVLKITPTQGSFGAGAVQLNITFEDKLDTMMTYNLISGLTSIDNISLNVQHNGTALDASQYKLGFDAESGLLYMHTMMGNIWQGQGKNSRFTIWSTTNKDGNWSSGNGNYNENAEYNDVIFDDLTGGSSTVYVQGTVNPGDVYFEANNTPYWLSAMDDDNGPGRLAAGTNIHKNGTGDVSLGLYNNMDATDALGNVDIQAGKVTLREALAVQGTVEVAQDAKLAVPNDLSFGTQIELKMGPNADGSFNYTVTGINFTDPEMSSQVATATLSGVTMDADGISGTPEAYGSLDKTQVTGTATLSHLLLTDSKITGNVELNHVTLTSTDEGHSQITGYYRLQGEMPGKGVTIGEGVVVDANGRYSLTGNINFADTLVNKGIIMVTNVTAEIGQINYSFTVDETGKSEYLYRFIRSEGDGRYDIYGYKSFTTEQVSINGVNLATGLADGVVADGVVVDRVVAEFTDNEDGSFTLSIGNVREDGTVDGTVGMPQWDVRWGKQDKSPAISRRYAGKDETANLVMAAGNGDDANYYKYSSLVNKQNADKVNDGKAIVVTLSAAATGNCASAGNWGSNATDYETWIYDRSGFKTVIGGLSEWADSPQSAATHVLVNVNYDEKYPWNKGEKDLVIGGSYRMSQKAESFVTVKNGHIKLLIGGSSEWGCSQTGTAHVFVDGGEVEEIFAAGYDTNLTGTQVEDGRLRAVELKLTGGTFGGENKRVFGGNHGYTVKGDIYIRMEGDANVTSQLVGGSNGGTVNGNIVLDLISGTANRVDAAGMGWGNEWNQTNSVTDGDVVVNLYRDFHLGTPTVNADTTTDWVGGKLYGGKELTESYIIIEEGHTSTLNFAEAGKYELGRLDADGYSPSKDSVTVTGFDKLTLADGAHVIVAMGMFDNDMLPSDKTPDDVAPLEISGKGMVEVIGHGENFGRNIHLTDNATLKISTSVISKTDDGADDRTITVTDGTTIDFSGFPVEAAGSGDELYAGLGFNVVIYGDGVDNKGSIYKGKYDGTYYPENDDNNKNAIHKITLPRVTLADNASVMVERAEFLYMNNNKLQTSYLNLNGNTLTKKGAGNFITRAAEMTKGTILVQEGVFGADLTGQGKKTDMVLTQSSSLKLNSTDVQEATSLTLRALSGAGNVELNYSLLTLSTTTNAKYYDGYMDEQQSSNQFMSSTGFAYAVFSGTISDGNKEGGILAKEGDGVHYISGSDNTYTGGTRIQDGRLYLLGTSAETEFSAGQSTVRSGAVGTGSIVWTGADAELYLDHGARIFNSGTTNVAGGIMTIGVEAAPAGTLGEYIGIHSKDENGNLTYVTMGGEEYVEIDTHSLKAIATNAKYADGTDYAAGSDINRNLMLLVKKADWEKAQATEVSGFSETGYNEATFSGVLRDTRDGNDVLAAKLHKVGEGTLELNQTNTYSGGTTISEGTLRLRGWGTLGKNEKANSTVLEKDGTSLMLSYIGGYGNEVTKIANDITLTGSGDTRWLNDKSTDGKTAALISVVGRAVTFTLSGDISGDGNLLHAGGGTLVLNGDSSYTGGSYVSSGTVKVQSADGLGATAKGQGSVTIEADADLLVTVEEGYTKQQMETTFAADKNAILGDVIITGTDTTERILHMDGMGYDAATTTLNTNGTLLINGGAIEGEAVTAHSALLSGNGALVVSDAAASGSTANIDAMVEFTGDFRVEGDRSTINVNSGAFIGGSIFVAGQQASVNTSGDVSIVDGESLYLHSTGHAASGLETGASISTTGMVSVAAGALLSVSNQDTEYAYNLSQLKEELSLTPENIELSQVVSPETKYVKFGDFNSPTPNRFDPTNAANQQASGAINAQGGLTLAGGATYETVKANTSLVGGRLTLDTMENSLLTFITTPNLNIEQVSNNTQLVLFSDVGGVYFGYDAVSADADSGIYYTRANRYITGCDYVDDHTLLVYDSYSQLVYLQFIAVPEPATATLSLLALAGLAARRRRSK